jgi:short-subunit dehydrogenase
MPPRRTALITGASSGIGRALATEYAAHHNKDLILVARSGATLESLAQSLREQHGCRVDVIVADLAEAEGAQTVIDAVRALGIHVDVLVNNAGFGAIGEFHQQDHAQVQRMVWLNCGAVVSLCHAFVPGMIAKGFGSVVNVSSLSAFAPMPYMTLYGATKAFVRSFSEGLRAEVQQHGLRVVALCPGPVATGFMRATGYRGRGGFVPDAVLTPMPQVLSSTLDALRLNRARSIPGLKAKLMALAFVLTPTRLYAAVARRALARDRTGSADLDAAAASDATTD